MQIDLLKLKNCDLHIWCADIIVIDIIIEIGRISVKGVIFFTRKQRTHPHSYQTRFQTNNLEPLPLQTALES